MIATLLPAAVRCADASTDAHDDELFPEERLVIAGAVEKRRREFATVRRCARAALGTLGVAPVAVLPGPRGEPRWPAGVVGSMTHCAGYRAAAVGLSAEWAGIGIDAEPARPLPFEVAEYVVTAPERAQLQGLPPEIPWDRLIFSAKESVFKVWYPLSGTELDFSDATVVFSGGSFSAQTARMRLTGRWACVNGLVLTAIALPAD